MIMINIIFIFILIDACSDDKNENLVNRQRLNHPSFRYDLIFLSKFYPINLERQIILI